jgi:uncharacterized protein
MKRIKRYFPKINDSFFLFGPRGTGKTTWLEDTYPDALVIDLLLDRHYHRFQSNPEAVFEIIEGSPDKKIIVIDEVQKIPELLNLIHHKMQKEPNLQFILTGSSSRKLKRAGIDLLAGRALLKRFHPFTAWELAEEFKLETALRFGMLPLVVSEKSPDDVLSTYASLYLREEVQMEGLVRNISHFSRFMEIMSFSHGQVLNLSEIARDCGIGRKAVESYVQILEDLLLAYQIPVFTKRAKRRTIQHNKFYYFDAGVFRELRPKGPLDRPEEIDGPALEGLILQHLLAWNDYKKKKAMIHFWRTQSGREVDFIVYGESTFMAIEVKNTGRVRAKDLGGLKGFLEDYPEASPFLIYRGNEGLLIDGIRCIPASDFLLKILPAL